MAMESEMLCLNPGYTYQLYTWKVTSLLQASTSLSVKCTLNCKIRITLPTPKVVKKIKWMRVNVCVSYMVYKVC